MLVIVQLFAFFAVVLGASVFGALLPSLYAASAPTSSRSHTRTYVRPSTSIAYTKVKQERAWVDPGYERGVFNAPAIAARFNPFLNATETDMVFWPEVVEEEQTWGEKDIVMRSFYEADYMENVYEIVEISEIADTTQFLAKVDKVIEATESLLKEIEELTEEEIEELWGKKEEIDAPDHHDTCVCHVCAPFGLSEMGLRLPEPKAHTKALLEELDAVVDTIGNPDRADVFYSRGYDPTEVPEPLNLMRV